MMTETIDAAIARVSKELDEAIFEGHEVRARIKERELKQLYWRKQEGDTWTVTF